MDSTHADLFTTILSRDMARRHEDFEHCHIERVASSEEEEDDAAIYEEVEAMSREELANIVKGDGEAAPEWYSGADDKMWYFVVNRQIAIPMCGIDGHGVLIRLRAEEEEHGSIWSGAVGRGKALAGLAMYTPSWATGPKTLGRQEE